MGKKARSLGSGSRGPEALKQQEGKEEFIFKKKKKNQKKSTKERTPKETEVGIYERRGRRCLEQVLSTKTKKGLSRKDSKMEGSNWRKRVGVTQPDLDEKKFEESKSRPDRGRITVTPGLSNRARHH